MDDSEPGYVAGNDEPGCVAGDRDPGYVAGDREPGYVDGNAAVGTFAEALGADVSAATVTCANCGRSGRFADRHVYDRGPGLVVRCPSCGEVNARVVRTPTDLWLELHGSISWRIPEPS